MRTILTLSAVAIVAAACAPRPYPQPLAEAPYLLQVPAPGTDYRYRGGPQGFGRTGPVYGPGPAYGPYDARPYHGEHGHGRAPHGQPPGYDGYGYGHGAHGERPHIRGYSDGYSWSDRRHSVRGGSSYESREMMTEETYVTGGVIVEREGPRAPHRPAPTPYPGAAGPQDYPGPYAQAPGHPAPPVQRPYPDAGPEPFY